MKLYCLTVNAVMKYIYILCPAENVNHSTLTLSISFKICAMQVERIASVRHGHLVELIGYCEHRNQLLLVYDYISNGNVGNYLNGKLTGPSPLYFSFISNFFFLKKIIFFYVTLFPDSEGLPTGKLDMRQRLSIALGAAKGIYNS